MRIAIGTFETLEKARVDAWIQAEQLVQASSKAQLADTGPKLLLTSASNGRSEGGAYDLAVQAFDASDRPRLHALVGAETGRRIWDQFEQYRAQPFFAVNQHPKYGQLYAQLAPDPEDSAIILATRRDNAFNASIRIEGRDDLAAFLTSGALEASANWMPTGEDLSEAIQYGDRSARSIHAAQQLFAGLAYTGLLNTAEVPTGPDVNRYLHLNERAVRPPIESFDTDGPEFYRWYEFGGIPRPEPLSQEQALFEQPGRFSVAEVSHTAISEADWEWFKSQKLGELRPAFDELQHALTAGSTPGWTSSAEPKPAWTSGLMAQADWCAHTKPPQPERVFDAVEKVLFRAELEAAAGLEVPAWIDNVREARDLIQAAFPGIEESMDYQAMKLEAQRVCELDVQAVEHEINFNEAEAWHTRQALKSIIQHAPHLIDLPDNYRADLTAERNPSNSSEMEM